jgi:hypothetical protein
MNKVVIIGGGMSGLIAAKHLEAMEAGWTGLEKGEKLGGRLMSSIPRVELEGNKARLEALFPEAGWHWIDEPPVEAKKGGWGPQAELPARDEAHFNRGPFFQPARLSEHWLLQAIPETVRQKFQLDKSVVRIDTSEKRIWCSDGSELNYSHALWCAPLADFFKACPGATPQWKIPKNRCELGCAVVEMHFSQTMVPNRNALSISFRYGDGKARALGTPLNIDDNKQVIFWNLYLEEGVADNKEEVAHCLRNFKRELFRQFPDFASKIESEKIIYLPRIILDEPVEGATLELAEAIFYLGSEARIKGSGSKSEHLDLLVENADYLFSRTELCSNLIERGI